MVTPSGVAVVVLRRSRHPLPPLQHLPFLVLLDHPPAVRTGIDRCLWPVLFVFVLLPFYMLPFQLLHGLAVRTRHLITALIPLDIFPLNPRHILYRWRGPNQDLASGECFGSVDSQLDWIPLIINIVWIGIDLIQQQITNRHRAQIRRTIGTGDK